MNRYSAIGILMCTLLSCRSETFLTVHVQRLDTLGERPGSLEILVARPGQAAASLPTLDLPQEEAGATQPSHHFVLKLPAGLDAREPLNLAVAAYSQPGARGCLLGTADKQVTPAEASGTTYVELERPPSPHCGDGRPVLLRAEPALSPMAGGVEVQLSGWGFRPDTKVRIGSQPADVLAVSATRLRVRTPSQAGFGPVPVRVSISETAFHERSDLLRYYTDSPSFNTDTPFSPKSDQKYAIVDMISAPLFPGTKESIIWTNRVTGELFISTFKLEPIGLDAVPFPTSIGTPGPYSPVGLVRADFDGDGDLDFAIGHSSSTKKAVEIFWNDGTGRISSNMLFDLPPVKSDMYAVTKVLDLAAADIDGDTDIDLVAVVSTVNPNNPDDYTSIYLNDGKGNFPPSSDRNGLDTSCGGSSSRIAVGNLGGSTHQTPDIVCLNQTVDKEANKVRILPNSGKGTFGTSSSYNIGQHLTCNKPSIIRRENLNGDSLLDFVIGCIEPTQFSIIVWFGREALMLPERLQLPLEAEPTDIAIADVNGDGLSDLLVVTGSGGDGKIYIFLQDFKTRSYGAPQTISYSGCPGNKRILGGNFDGDSAGTTDIFIGATDPMVAGSGCVRGYQNLSGSNLSP